jgi:hypothetical protein
VIVVLLAAVAIGVFLVKQEQAFRNKAASVTSSLIFSTNKISAESGEKFSVDVILNTGGQEIVGVDVLINFDPKVAKLISIKLPQRKILSTYLPLSEDSDLTFNEEKVVACANSGEHKGSRVNCPFSEGKIGFAAFSYDFQDETKKSAYVGIINPLVTLIFKVDESVSDVSDVFMFDFAGNGVSYDTNVSAVSPDALPEDVLMKPDSFVTVAVGDVEFSSVSLPDDLDTGYVPRLRVPSDGDINEDGVVSEEDLELVLGSWGEAGVCDDYICDVIYNDALVNTLDAAFVYGRL